MGRGWPWRKSLNCRKKIVQASGQCPPGGLWRASLQPPRLALWQVGWAEAGSLELQKGEEGHGPQLLPALQRGQLHQAHAL